MRPFDQPHSPPTKSQIGNLCAANQKGGNALRGVALVIGHGHGRLRLALLVGAQLAHVAHAVGLADGGAHTVVVAKGLPVVFAHGNQGVNQAGASVGGCGLNFLDLGRRQFHVTHGRIVLLVRESGRFEVYSAIPQGGSQKLTAGKPVTSSEKVPSTAGSITVDTMLEMT